MREKAAGEDRRAHRRRHAAPAGSEVALAAVDEGLLELAPNPSWKLLDAMMGRRAYGVTTATAQMQVVGKRHYGLKALPLGGGGGRSADARALRHAAALAGPRPARRPRPRDGRGAAQRLAHQLPHRRGRARAASTASAPAPRSIRATQDVMVLPGLPPVVREGDRFRAEFTARNTTSAADRR